MTKNNPYQGLDSLFIPALIREYRYIEVLVLPDAYRSVTQVVCVSVGPYNTIQLCFG